ncbi:MAG: sugar phosphate isomerase/epimerase [Anaerolineaceae bacterium]
MKTSISTATLFWIPFERTLDLITKAGFQNIELDLFWERKDWCMAQHLRIIPAKQAVRRIEASGLTITSIHDTGGVLESVDSTTGFVDPVLDNYLDVMGHAPDCLVFHTPHVEGIVEDGWFNRISRELVKCLEKYRKVSPISIENMQVFDGYTVPLNTPGPLKSFVDEYGLGVTLDTSHYTQMGVDIIQAASVLGSSIKTIHLSDCIKEKRHVFIGEGDLDLPGLLKAIDRAKLIAVNLECTLSTCDKSDQDMDDDELVERLAQARIRMEDYLST